MYLALELAVASYFQEAKIDNMDVRRAIHANVIFDNFLNGEIKKWTEEENPMRYSN